METVLITGGTGMVGRYLTQNLQQKGYAVNWLSRKAGETSIGGDKKQGNKVQVFQWDIDKQTIDSEAISSADHIIHLAGAGVADKRWTPKRKEEILDSRTKSSALIVKALSEIPNKVKTVVSASAIGWYGPDRPDSKSPFTEDAPYYSGFLGDTCKAWEDSIAPVTTLNKRLVRLRIGIVVSGTGGAITEFKKPLRAGIAPIFGSGKQIVSWIHIYDLCNFFLYAMENRDIQGIFNAVAPNPVSSRALIFALGRSMEKKLLIPVPVPSFLLKIILGEMSIEILKSATVSSKKAEAAGFQFSYPTIEQAVENL
ncbi:MAG TPA: TIGR01777 family protein [Chitinophagaceae bacterium]|nr:TIGR01777 family protein [Chitinophagaceae bacterium]